MSCIEQCANIVVVRCRWRDHSATSPGPHHVRGCEVTQIRDEAGILMNDFTGRVRPEDWAPPKGTLRTITVALDPAQYQSDVEAAAAAKAAGGAAPDVYASFNLLMRRKAKENNFKAVLECIRDLIGKNHGTRLAPRHLAWVR